MEIPITQERNPEQNGQIKPRVIQCKVTDIKIPPRLRMIAYQGPFEHLIERALTNSDSRSTAVKDSETGGKSKGTHAGDESYEDSARAQSEQTISGAGKAEGKDETYLKPHTPKGVGYPDAPASSERQRQSVAGICCGPSPAPDSQTTSRAGKAGFTDKIPTRQNNAVSDRAHSGVGPSAILNTPPALDSQTTSNHQAGEANNSQSGAIPYQTLESSGPPAPFKSKKRGD